MRSSKRSVEARRTSTPPCRTTIPEFVGARRTSSSSKAEALAYGREILEKKIGGTARFLIEEKLVGEESSLQAFCDGRALVPMPLAQDHKRAYEGDKGPNTGGMGSYSDADHRLPFLTNEDFDRALETMAKTVEAMATRGTPFKGILYGGFMATKDGPMLLEYNVRFAEIGRASCR